MLFLTLFVLIFVSGVISQEVSVAPTALPPGLGFVPGCFPRCPPGSMCQKQVLICIRAPCLQPNPPRYSCVPNPKLNPCDRISCPEGTYCIPTGSTARCVKKGGCVNTCRPGRYCPAICIWPLELQ